MSFLKALGKFLLWLVVIAGLLYGGWYFYNYLVSKGVIENASNQATTLGETAKQKANNYANAVVSSTEQAASSYIKEKIGEIISSAGQEIIHFGNNVGGVSSTVPSGGNTVLGSPDSSAAPATPPPATIAIGVGKPLSFSITSGENYQADWGDGNSDEGMTAAGGPTALQHAWAKAGDYMVKMTVGNGAGNTVYSFPVRVY